MQPLGSPSSLRLPFRQRKTKWYLVIKNKMQVPPFTGTQAIPLFPLAEGVQEGGWLVSAVHLQAAPAGCPHPHPQQLVCPALSCCRCWAQGQRAQVPADQGQGQGQGQVSLSWLLGQCHVQGRGRRSPQQSLPLSSLFLLKWA